MNSVLQIEPSSLDENDGIAARAAVESHNERLDEGETPLATSPNSALLTSYETLLGGSDSFSIVQRQHGIYLSEVASQGATAREAKERWKISTPAQRQASVDQLEPL